jgi:predicted aldo/keto reductase-like oxidoreductase
MGFIAMKPMGGGLLDNAGLSFRYLAQFDSIIPDPGIETIEEIQEIAGIIEKRQPLSATDREEIDKQRAEFGPSWCHRCDYCQPCPEGIHISSALCMESALKRMPLERARGMIGPAIEKARTCRSCGACVSRCPYHLEIPALLRERIAYWDRIA